jgi:probable rRNA maturation factor
MIELEIVEISDAEEFISQKMIDAFSLHLNEKFGARFEGVINVSFVSDEEIKRLNRMYRQKDAVTDVLSFTYEQQGVDDEVIGDVVISLEQARRQAEDGDIELELADLLVHGVLHVLGYDHEISAEEAKIMFELQDDFVNKII